MAIDTLATLVSDIALGLGEPPTDYLSIEDITRAAYQSLQYYATSLQQSSENQIIAHYDFTANERTINLTGALNLGTPAWVERQLVIGQYQSWKFIPSVNLAMLESSRLRGDDRCAFYSENGFPYIKLSLDPQLFVYQNYRLWYDPNPILASVLEDTVVGNLVTGIPAMFTPMISSRAMRQLIPLMAAKAEQSESKPSEALMQSWGGMLSQAKEDLADWRYRWQVYCYGARDGQVGRRRRNVLGSGVGPFPWPGYRGNI